MYSWYKAKYEAGVVGYCTKGHPHMTSPSFGGEGSKIEENLMMHSYKK